MLPSCSGKTEDGRRSRPEKKHIRRHARTVSQQAPTRIVLLRRQPRQALQPSEFTKQSLSKLQLEDAEGGNSAKGIDCLPT